MTPSNTLNLKFSNLQLKKLKSGTRNGTQVTLKFSSNEAGGSNDETNFPHKLLTNTQVSKIREAFTEKENHESGMHPLVLANRTISLIISNEEIDDTIRIVRSLKDTGLLIKGVYKTNKNKAKEQKGEFLSMLLGTLDSSALQNLTTGKGTKKSNTPRQGIMRADKGTNRKGLDF